MEEPCLLMSTLLRSYNKLNDSPKRHTVGNRFGIEFEIFQFVLYSHKVLKVILHEIGEQKTIV